MRDSCCLYFKAPRGTYCDNCSVSAAGRHAWTAT
ncbi:MAG: (2Fe-2S)-binding protein [Haloechinothrix sp.]